MTKEKKILKFQGQIKEVDINQLIPYEFNNKIHKEKKVDLLANIINKFGYIDEIIVDKNNIVIAGHGRLESIKKMGYDAVEVKVLDIDSKNASELRLLHNMIAEYETENDLENIKIEFDSLGYSVEIDGLGVSFKELRPEFDAPVYNPDDYSEEDEEKETKIGVLVFVKDDVEQTLLIKDLEGLGYKEYKKIG